MSKFQPPMLNDDVCRAATNKQIHKHTYTHIHKYTYRVKTEETFLLLTSTIDEVYLLDLGACK